MIIVLQHLSIETCSCPFARYFRKLFWDDIEIICWWKLSKQTSYWSKTGFFSQLKKQTIFSSQIIVVSQNNIQKYGTKGHEQVFGRPKYNLKFEIRGQIFSTVWKINLNWYVVFFADKIEASSQTLRLLIIVLQHLTFVRPKHNRGSPFSQSRVSRAALKAEQALPKWT